MREVADILKQFLEQLAVELKANIPKASGETANSVEVRVSIDGSDEFAHVKWELLAAPYIQALEDGRGPTRKSGGGSKSLRQSILEWINHKGFNFPTEATSFRKSIKSAEQLSWAIAIKIHKEGNKLYRDGGKSGVISNVITDNRIDNFIQVFNSKAARIILNKVVKTVNT